MKAVEIMDGFLPVHDFNYIKKNTLNSREFPLYYEALHLNSPEFPLYYEALHSGQKNDGYYLVHAFYMNGKISHWFDVVSPLLERLEIKQLLRVRLNFYPKTHFLRKNHNWHNDYPYKHKGCILSLNTCNGKTQIKNKPFNFSIKSIENRALFFDPFIQHRSTTCTNAEFRSNIIINYL